jgi:hypothetical protein
MLSFYKRHIQSQTTIDTHMSMRISLPILFVHVFEFSSHRTSLVVKTYPTQFIVAGLPEQIKGQYLFS